jgi:transposase
MSSKRFTEEFRIEAVKQVTERGYPVKEVSERLGVSTWSLYEWIKRFSAPPEARQADMDQAARIKRLESELRRVTEERDILKKAAAYFAKESR